MFPFSSLPILKASSVSKLIFRFPKYSVISSLSGFNVTSGRTYCFFILPGGLMISACSPKRLASSSNRPRAPQEPRLQT